MQKPDASRGLKIGKRLVALAAAGIGLYVVWPSVVEIFSAWPQLIALDPWWLLGMLVCEATSFALLWLVLELALHTDRTALVATSQLSSSAFGRVMPGGAAAATALQYRLLAQGGLDSGAVAAALAATQLLTTAVLAALPLFSLPAIIGGAAVDRKLILAAVLGIAVFALIVAGTTILFAADRALAYVARTAQSLRNHVLRKREPLRDLPTRLVEQRDSMLATLGGTWWLALTAAAGKVLLDFFALLCALTAVGTHPRPGLVLLAFVAASLLGMIPITPGGLGFVEAGLSSTLVLAGVGAADAVLATLAYRLASYWLPLVAGAFAYGGYRASYRARVAQ